MIALLQDFYLVISQFNALSISLLNKLDLLLSRLKMLSNFFLSFLLFASISAIESADPVPVWPKQFFFELNETFVNNNSFWLLGMYAIDLTYQNGSEAFYRSDGSFNGICASLHPGYHGPCSQVVTNGYRYIIQPDLDYCCQCCSNDDGCGAIKQEWVDTAVYVGQQNISGQLCDHWTISGFDANDLMETADGKQDICFLSNAGEDLFTVMPGTYKVGPPDTKLFALPEKCVPCPAGTPDCTISPAPVEPMAPSADDVQRAENWFPRDQYKGRTLQHASSVLNRHLHAIPNLQTKPCEQFTLSELDQAQILLSSYQAPSLSSIYHRTNDPRQIQYTGDEAKLQIWSKMNQLGKQDERINTMLRDGRCRETVMWYIHHLSEGDKEQVKQVANFVLPLLPEGEEKYANLFQDEDGLWAYEQYKNLVTCQQCHL